MLLITSSSNTGKLSLTVNKTRNYQPYPATDLRDQSHPGKLSQDSKIILLVLLHIPLALLLRNVRVAATAHALVTFAIGAYIALTTDQIKRVIPIVAYIAGAEVLWRMTKANIFWEFGKYATVAILILALLKTRKISKAGWPLVYFLLLLPSILLTVELFGLTRMTRNAISFNLSGPLAACVAMIFFQQIKTDPAELGGWLWGAVYPILSILTLAAYNTLTATEIQFGTESIFTTSGGFGPNQVSAMLGLGALILIMLAIQAEGTGKEFWILGLALALLVQSLLTFSRGGVLNVLVAIPLAFIHLFKSTGKWIQRVFFVFVLALAAYFLILPQLDAFTGGALNVRYTDLSLTGREEIARADLQLFIDNPVFGVGPGLSAYRRSFMSGAAAHTEYTRIIAEHGSAGVLSLLVLLLLLLFAYLRAPAGFSRAWVVALAAWPLLEMGHAAMRIVAIPLLLGLAMVQWQPSSNLVEPNQIIDDTPYFQNNTAEQSSHEI